MSRIHLAKLATQALVLISFFSGRVYCADSAHLRVGASNDWVLVHSDALHGPRTAAEKKARLAELRARQAAARAAKLEQAKQRRAQSPIRNPELANYDTNANGFLEGEEYAKYQADRAAAAAKPKE